MEAGRRSATQWEFTRKCGLLEQSRCSTTYRTQRGKPSSYVFSILFHVVAIGVIAYALKHGPRIQDHSTSERYTVRLMNLRFEETPPPSRGLAEAASLIPAPRQQAILISLAAVRRPLLHRRKLPH